MVHRPMCCGRWVIALITDHSGSACIRNHDTALSKGCLQSSAIAKERDRFEKKAAPLSLQSGAWTSRTSPAREVRRRTRDAHQTLPTRAHRRQKCATVLNIFGMAQRSAAPSVTESLVSSGTTPGELPSVQRSALIASRPARTATADGCCDSKPPDKQLQ
jgi:hypothetical protein